MCTDYRPTLAGTHKAQVSEGTVCIAASVIRAKWRWLFNATHRPLYLPERLGTYCTGGWVHTGAGLEGCGKSRPPPSTGIRFTDRLARGESLY
jgi:hypothetical protein